MVKNRTKAYIVYTIPRMQYTRMRSNKPFNSQCTQRFARLCRKFYGFICNQTF